MFVEYIIPYSYHIHSVPVNILCSTFFLLPVTTVVREKFESCRPSENDHPYLHPHYGWSRVDESGTGALSMGKKSNGRPQICDTVAVDSSSKIRRLERRARAYISLHARVSDAEHFRAFC